MLAVKMEEVKSKEAEVNRLLEEKEANWKGILEEKEKSRLYEDEMKLADASFKINDLHLVLTGNGSHYYKMLDELIVPTEVRAKIFIPVTFIDSQDLAVLYSNAVCFFFMSLYEGFGLPALEAMQCGTPVVVSNTTSLPEVVGTAALVAASPDRAASDLLRGLKSNSYPGAGQ